MWIDVVAPVIPALGKLRQEDSTVKASPAYTGRLWVFFKVVAAGLQNLCGICTIPSWLECARLEELNCMHAVSPLQEEHLKALLLAVLKRRFLPHHNSKSHSTSLSDHTSQYIAGGSTRPVHGGCKQLPELRQAPRQSRRQYASKLSDAVAEAANADASSECGPVARRAASGRM